MPSDRVHSLHLYLKLIQERLILLQLVLVEIPLPKVHRLKRENTYAMQWNQAEKNLILCLAQIVHRVNDHSMWFEWKHSSPRVVRKQTLRNSDTIYRQGLLSLYGRVILRDLDNNVIN